MKERSKFDSAGEMHFSYWTDELIEAGYIEQVVLQPEPYMLSGKVSKVYNKVMKTKTKKMEQTILREHIYTPDVLIIWTSKAYGVFIPKGGEKTLPHQLNYSTQQFENRDVAASTLELKPAFDQNNMTRLASINIKWVYEKYKHVVDIVKLPKFFEKTFTPDKYLLTDKSHVPRKIKFKTKSLTEFISSLQK